MPTYTVRPGDTLSAIAAQFNTNVQAIVDTNHIANPNMIFVGQQLTIADGSSGGGNAGATLAEAAATPAGGVSAFVVGPGLLQAMTADGTMPSSDEIYVHGNRTEAQWSEAMGRNGTIYRWVQSTNSVLRFPARQ